MVSDKHLRPLIRMARRTLSGRVRRAATRALFVLLAAILLATSFTGHAGVQIIDGALAQDLLRLHQHGVPGEAAYIHTHGTWEGYVAGHCHAVPTVTPLTDPDQVTAAATLAGAAACLWRSNMPVVPATHLPTTRAEVAAVLIVAAPPLTPPPRA